MREIALDTETTGLSYLAGDRIIEVGCVEMTNHVPTGNTLSFYCKVDKQISEEAEKITGISNAFLSDKKTFGEEHQRFLDFVQDDPLIIHNSSFDMGFINNELSLINKGPLKNEVVDTVALARKVLKSRTANLDYLCRHFDIDLSKRKLHGALLDAELLAEVYLELRGGKQFSMDLKNNKLEQTKTKQEPKNDAVLVKIPCLEKDLKSHKLMVKSIKDPIWSKYEY